MPFPKTPDEVKLMATGGQLLTEVLEQLIKEINGGLANTGAIDERAEALIRERGAIPAFKNYRGYPASVCISINSEVVHGIPSARKELKAGDLVSLDIGLVYHGWYCDMAESLVFGGPEKNPIAQKLIVTTREALALGIRQAVVGNAISAIGGAIQKHAEHNNYGVVRELVGHGIGKELHEDPQVPNYRTGKEKAVPLVAGMVIAIEPMITLGDWRVFTHTDGWTVETVDHSLAAHVERTVAITAKGPQILTPLSLRS